MNAIVKIGTETTAVTSVNNVIEKTRKLLAESRKSPRLIAISLLELKKEMKKNDETRGLKFPEFVSSVFSEEINGATAYKYTQCAEMFAGPPAESPENVKESYYKTPESDIWSFTSIGVMIVLLALTKSITVDGVKKQVYKDGVSVGGLCSYIGEKSNDREKAIYTEWLDKNTERLKSRDLLIQNGLSPDSIPIEEKPEVSPIPDDAKNRDTAIYEKGMNVLVNSPVSKVKEFVAEYLEKSCKEEKKTKKTAPAPAPAPTPAPAPAPAEKSLAEIKADTLNLLIEYQEKSGDTSRVITSAIKYFQSEE